MRTDELLDDAFDLIDLGDEWEEGDSDQTDVELICLTEKGDNTQFPFAGFGVFKRLHSRTDKKKFKRELKVELENDGFMNPTINFGNDIKDFTIEI